MDPNKKTKRKHAIIKNSHVYFNDKHLRQIPNKIEDSTVVLYLHNNVITKLENLDALFNVTHLYLQWNRIRKIENLNCLYNLKKLYLGNNHISVIENLEVLYNLKELHIEKQILDYGETLCFDPRCLVALSDCLEVLNVSDNKLSRIDELGSLHSLNFLYARNNSFIDYNKLLPVLKQLTNLKQVDFRGNLMCKIPRYKEKIIASCFRLEVLDDQVVKNVNRQFLKCFENKNKQKKTCNSYTETEKTGISSPDSQLALIEAERAANMQLRQERKKSKEMKGNVPRCFWKNKIFERVRPAQENLSSNFNNFLKSTSSTDIN